MYMCIYTYIHTLTVLVSFFTNIFMEICTGTSKINSIVTALHQKANATLFAGGFYFYYILLLGEPGHLGRDEQGSEIFVANFRAKVRR